MICHTGELCLHPECLLGGWVSSCLELAGGLAAVAGHLGSRLGEPGPLYGIAPRKAESTRRPPATGMAADERAVKTTGQRPMDVHS